jgi:hypothetical protein
MAKLNESFVADDMPKNERSGDFEPLPAGWYDVRITAAELKETNARTGQYIKLRYDVVGPTHQGRVVFGNLNIRNPNPKAEEIGRQQLGEIMRAVGLPRVDDTDQLIGKSLTIKLTIKPADAQYSAGNEVKGFKASGGSMPPSASTGAAPAKSSSAPPWAKK